VVRLNRNPDQLMEPLILGIVLLLLAGTWLVYRAAVATRETRR
jgi:hypothetical protein